MLEFIIFCVLCSFFFSVLFGMQRCYLRILREYEKDIEILEEIKNYLKEFEKMDDD